MKIIKNVNPDEVFEITGRGTTFVFYDKQKGDLL